MCSAMPLSVRLLFHPLFRFPLVEVFRAQTSASFEYPVACLNLLEPAQTGPSIHEPTFLVSPSASQQDPICTHNGWTSCIILEDLNQHLRLAMCYSQLCFRGSLMAQMYRLTTDGRSDITIANMIHSVTIIAPTPASSSLFGSAVTDFLRQSIRLSPTFPRLVFSSLHSLHSTLKIIHYSLQIAVSFDRSH